MAEKAQWVKDWEKRQQDKKNQPKHDPTLKYIPPEKSQGKGLSAQVKTLYKQMYDELKRFGFNPSKKFHDMNAKLKKMGFWTSSINGEYKLKRMNQGEVNKTGKPGTIRRRYTMESFKSYQLDENTMLLSKDLGEADRIKIGRLASAMSKMKTGTPDDKDIKKIGELLKTYKFTLAAREIMKLDTAIRDGIMKMIKNTLR